MGVVTEGVAICKMASTRKRDPSHVAKGRISNLVQQDIEEFGKIVRYARQSSNSKDVNNIFAFIYSMMVGTDTAKSCKENSITRAING